MNRLVYLVIIALSALVLYSTAAPADSTNPFSAEQIQFITQYHQKLLESYDIDYRVLPSADTGDINLLANTHFAEAKIGSVSKTGRGMLLVINTRQNLVRLEVSKNLESVYTDAFVSYIEHRQMIPFFKAGQVANGVLASTELIFARAADAVAGKAFDEHIAAGSAGGGAVNNADIGKGVEAKSTETMAAPEAESGPKEVVAAYLAAMKQRNSNPDLSIYSEATRQMMSKWVVTPAQMDMLASTYEKCTPKWSPFRADKAAVIYPINERTCAPFFLVKENGSWKLDLTMMQTAIRFNHLNEWHFDMKVRHPYEFAFSGWQLDANGYPTSGRQPRWNLTYETGTVSGQRITVVTGVGAGSFAESAGFQVGDIILKWNDSAMPTYLTISRLIDGANEGDPYTIIIQRGQNHYTIAGKSPPRSK